jgi:NAD-dependent SIR2 family protein deacetylase
MSTSVPDSVINTRPVHGFLGNPDWQLPRIVVECTKEARLGMEGTKAAHEYEEEEAVFRSKIDLLAKLIMSSRNCIAYTGAGISTSSGVPDYASQSAGNSSQVHKLLASKTPTNSKASLFDKAEKARPTLAHKVLCRLYHAGWLKWWCQQNHDGLPQKAGVPQEIMNEIHGSWFDPSNRVIAFSENLRDDFFQDLLEWEQKADVCLAVGTSLSGMNADRLVVSTASRAKARFKKFLKSYSGEWNAEQFSSCGGSVIIGYQCTQLDESASLRIYSTIDKVFQALSAKLVELTISNRALHQLFSEPFRDNPLALLEHMAGRQEYTCGRIVADNVYELTAYDPTSGGKIDTSRAEQRPMILDLRKGSRLRFMIGIDKDCFATVTGRDEIGNYQMDCEVNCRYRKADGTCYRAMGHSVRVYGLWNVLSALEGKLSLVPFTNVPK